MNSVLVCFTLLTTVSLTAGIQVSGAGAGKSLMLFKKKIKSFLSQKTGNLGGNLNLGGSGIGGAIGGGASGSLGLGNVLSDLGKLQNSIPDFKKITEGGPICGAFHLGDQALNWLNGHIVKDVNGAVHLDAVFHNKIKKMIDRVLDFILGLRELFVNLVEQIISFIIKMKFAEIGLLKHFFEIIPKALFHC